MNKNLMTTSGLVVAGVLFLAVNILAGTALRSARFDLTENKLYTLSEGTKSILRELDEEITLRFFFSKTLAQEIPSIQAYGKRVQELLEELAAVSDKLTLIVEEPQPFSEAEDRAVGFGLRGAPANRTGDMLYFGLAATNTTDDTETVPFFSPEREEFLEYDLTQLIYKLDDPERPVVGLITQLPLAGNPQGNPYLQQPPTPAWVIHDQLGDMFELRDLAWDTRAIDADVDVLVLVHPKALPESTLYAVDQFVLRGGHALVFVDPFCEADQPPRDPQNPLAGMQAPRSSDLAPLLGTWGVDFSTDDAIGDRARALEVRTQEGAPSPFVIWAALRSDKEDFSTDDAVTAQLGTIHVASAGILQPIGGAETTFSPLLSSSDEAGRIETRTLAFQQIAPDPAGLLDSLSVEGERFTVAARISGPARTAYPNGDPLAGEEEDETELEDEELPAHRSESEGPINVIVVADADLLTDRFWVRVQNFLGTRLISPIADNGDLVVNAVENLTGSNDLISLRSRGRFQRPFDRVIELRREAEARFRDKEKELEDKLRDTERKLAELQQGKEGVERMILSDEQVAELERFKEQRLRTRKELRQVKLQLNQDIESLGKGLKLGNILGLPLAVALFGFATFALRSKKKS